MLTKAGLPSICYLRTKEKFYMLRVLASLLFLLITAAVYPQQTLDVNREGGAANLLYTVSGQPFMKARFAKVIEGSAFFNEQFMQGAIILSEGREYKYKLVRLNILDKEINYIDNRGDELVATTPIREVILWDTISKTDHRFVVSEYIEADKKPEKDFYELLQSGAAELYKQYKKTLVETQVYGNATWEQKIFTDTRYYLLHQKQWRRIKKLNDLPEFFADKKKELQQFITTKNLSGDSEENFTAVVKYYNSLFNN
jgi:hypothetical protein